MRFGPSMSGPPISYCLCAGMDCYNYNYTVGSLLHDAGRHRRSDQCCSNCQCEDDHVIELRLVVDALASPSSRRRFEPLHVHRQTLAEEAGGLFQ